MPVSRANAKIFLVGFMGAGKTTLGRMLADALAWPFLDLDSFIEDSEGTTITKIFAEKGEPFFRDLERHALSRLAQRPERAVIACGGGTFCTEENEALMQRHGIAVWLDQSFGQIWARREELAHRRPLMGLESEVRSLYDQRTAVYRRAPVHVRIPEGTWAEPLGDLLRQLKERREI